MSHRRGQDLCEAPAGHADWSAHLLGFLSADPNPDVRRSLLGALQSAAVQYPLPTYARIRTRELADEFESTDDLF
jgi:hypothetical protein